MLSLVRSILAIELNLKADSTGIRSRAQHRDGVKVQKEPTVWFSSTVPRRGITKTKTALKQET
jgi:hypothetical protein